MLTSMTQFTTWIGMVWISNSSSQVVFACHKVGLMVDSLKIPVALYINPIPFSLLLVCVLVGYHESGWLPRHYVRTEEGRLTAMPSGAGYVLRTHLEIREDALLLYKIVVSSLLVQLLGEQLPTRKCKLWNRGRRGHIACVIINIEYF